MATLRLNIPMRMLPFSRQTGYALSSSRFCQATMRSYTTPTAPTNDPPTAPLLLKLREDLKSAMKAKDKTRLNVLRSVLSDVTNASKRSQAVNSDMQVLAILRKRSAASKEASEKFEQENRKDLSEKEEAEVEVLEEYAHTVKTMSYEEVKEEVAATMEQMRGPDGKVDKGKLLGRLLKAGGPLEGKSVETTTVARVVQDLFAAEAKAT